MKNRLDQSRADVLTAQKQVWHAERLAAIGRLASGLAHEINNPINGVRNCIYAIREDLDNKEQTVEYLGMMDEGLTSASAVLTKLLGFARKQQSGSGPVQLNEAVESVTRLVHFNLERSQVRLMTDLDPQLPRVIIDAQLVQEVIMNLVLNANDASAPGGVITVQTRQQDGQVVMVVRDEGHGISEANLQRIFDPFFTTKEPGEGTGLGLSICQSIVEAAGGTLAVESSPGKGSAFSMRLPLPPLPPAP